MWTELEELPAQRDFKEESHLPSCPTGGIYLLLSAADRVVYVGQSGDIRLRLSQHRAERRKPFVRALFYPLDCLSTRLRFEGILTLALLPVFNRGLNLGLVGGRVWEIRWGSGNRRKSSRKPS